VHYLETLKISQIVVSPLLRARQTIEPFRKIHPKVPVYRESGINEMEYGSWSGKKISLLSKRPLWSAIQNNPSSVTFPDGESFLEMLARAMEAIHRHAAPGKRTLFVSHGDVIKTITAHLLGMNIDQFQRISIDPASLTSITITPRGGHIHFINQTSHVNEKISAPGSSTLGGGSGSTLKDSGK
jgi:probable phosphoglycerate mutase